MQRDSSIRFQDRIASAFAKQFADQRSRLIPYFTAGFPDSSTVEKLILRADKMGVTAIEVGFPYSDSIADGPVIQSSFYHALDHGFRVSHALEMIARVRRDVACPIIAMLSFSIVHRMGVDRFMKEAAEAGFDGVIVPDVSDEEAAVVRGATDRAGLACIGMIGPRTGKVRAIEIARHSSGFLYIIAAAGTTGERRALSPELRSLTSELRTFTDLPLCVGFGIGNAEQVREVCQFADAAIVGSAIIKRIADGLSCGLSNEALVESVAEFLAQLLGKAKQ